MSKLRTQGHEQARVQGWREQATSAKVRASSSTGWREQATNAEVRASSSTGWREQATNAKARASSSARVARASYERKSTSKLSAKSLGQKTESFGSISRNNEFGEKR